jgi:hypothetical protein
VFFAQVKNNIGHQAQTLAYRIATRDIGLERPLPYIDWQGAVDMTADDTLAQARAAAKQRVNPVHEFLRDILANGPVLQKVVVERGAAKRFSLGQLQRARKAVGAVAFKRRDGTILSPWLWAMPEFMPSGGIEIHEGDDFPLNSS